MTAIEFLYDFGSPNAFLVHKVLPGLAERAGAELLYRPVLLGGIFKAANNQSPMQAFAGVKGKLAHQNRQIDRFVQRHGITFNWNPHFPVNTLGLMRGAAFAQGQPWERSYIDAIFQAMWQNGEKMDDPNVIERVLRNAELPAEDILAATQQGDVKQKLIDATQAAVARGAYGSPTMFVGDEMFFGKDSLDELEWFVQR